MNTLDKLLLSTLALALPLAVAAGCADSEPDQILAEELALDQPAPGGCAATLFAPGEISLADRSEYRLAFSPDGKTAYYHVDAEGTPRQAIYTTRLVDGHWTPGAIVSFSGVWDDSDPFVSPDGKSLYFSSTRPVAGVSKEDTDLWVVRRKNNGGWGEPQHIDNVSDPTELELYPSVDADGNLYFASPKAGGLGGWDIYRARRTAHGYATPENVGPSINTDLWEFNPWISPSGRLLLFVGLNHPEGHGLGDIYASVRLFGNTWTPAFNLGDSLNTERDEFHPTLSPDRRYLYVVRQTWDPLQPSDFFRIPTGCLHAE